MAAKAFTYAVNRSSNAPAALLFELVSDGSRWPEWAKPIVLSGAMVREGKDHRLGVGAVRKLGAGRFGVKEQTTAYEKDHLHGYTLITPGPVKDYHAEVRLTPRADGGTDLSWTGSFVERVPGTGIVVQRAFTSVIGALATKLVKAAERAR